MSYSLERKQLVKYPYCRIYRSTVQAVAQSETIRKNGTGLLFSFIRLFSVINFRKSHRTIHSCQYAIEPGEWVMNTAELQKLLCTKYQYQAFAVLERLQGMNLLRYTRFPAKIIRISIPFWECTNTTRTYSAPCSKDTGFYFFPVKLLSQLLKAGRCSEADMFFDLWISTVYNDPAVGSSAASPVVYLRDGSGNASVQYAQLACRWGVSKSTVCRFLQKLTANEMAAINAAPGEKGCRIMLTEYMPTMFPAPNSTAVQQIFYDAFPSVWIEDADDWGDISATQSAAPVALQAESVAKTQILGESKSEENPAFSKDFQRNRANCPIYGLSVSYDWKEAISYRYNLWDRFRSNRLSFAAARPP